MIDAISSYNIPALDNPINLSKSCLFSSECFLAYCIAAITLANGNNTLSSSSCFNHSTAYIISEICLGYSIIMEKIAICEFLASALIYFTPSILMNCLTHDLILVKILWNRPPNLSQTLK